MIVHAACDHPVTVQYLKVYSSLELIHENLISYIFCLLSLNIKHLVHIITSCEYVKCFDSWYLLSTIIISPFANKQNGEITSWFYFQYLVWMKKNILISGYMLSEHVVLNSIHALHAWLKLKGYLAPQNTTIFTFAPLQCYFLKHCYA